MKKYGLKIKREIWLLQAMLRSYRRLAKKLIALKGDPKAEKQKEQLIKKLQRLGLLGENATLDDVLKLTVEDFLERRLTTIVYKKGLALTPKQARQFIVHGHIMVNGKIIRSPNYLVKVEEEGKIEYAPYSPLRDKNHTIRKQIANKLGLKEEKKEENG